MKRGDLDNAFQTVVHNGGIGNVEHLVEGVEIREKGRVDKHGGDSAYRGLTVLAGAFRLLLDSYANPNAENELGMCDDPALFRQHFADIIVNEVPRQ